MKSVQHRMDRRCARLARAATVLGTCVLLLSGCGLWIGSSERLERAREARQKGDTRAAIIQLKELLQEEPNMAEARLELGTISLGVGDIPSAVTELELARKGNLPAARIVPPLARAYLAAQRAQDALLLIEAAPELESDSSALSLKGTALLELDRTNEAHEVFSRAAQVDPRSIDAILGLASVVARVEGVTEALAVTDRALAIGSETARVHLARGALQLQSRNFQAAEAEFGIAAEQATRQSSPVELLAALAGLADAQLGRGNAELALATTQRMQQHAPNNIVTRYQRARALFMVGRLDEARPLLEQNLAANPGHTLSKLLLGAVLLARGDLGQSEMYLAAVVTVEPRNAAARQLLAEARLRAQKPEDALDALMPVLDSPEASSQLLALAGRASLAAGATASGLQYLQRGANSSSGTAEATLELAAGYISTGQIDRARAVLDSMPQDEASSPRRTYLTVLTHLAKGDTQRAVEQAEAAAKAEPTSTASQVLAGALLAQLGRFQLAQIYFERAQQLEPKSATPYVNLGRLASMRGDLSGARKHFEQALQSEPGHPGASLALAFLDLGQERTDHALATLEAARKRNPRFLEGRALETQILLDLGDFEQAAVVARALVRDAPERASAHVAYGRVLAASGRVAQSIETLVAASRRLPHAVSLRYELARTYLADSQFERAKSEAAAVLELDKRNLGAMELMSRAEHALGDAAAASRWATELMRFAPDQVNSHLLQGDLALARKEYKVAVAAYSKAGTLSGDATAAWKEFSARRQGGMGNALDPLERKVAQRPNDTQALMALAEAQQQAGAPDRAAGTYERVLQIAPTHAAALNNLAWLKHQQGKPEALTFAKRAYEAAPKRAEIADTYAWILIERGEVRRGLTLLQPIAGPNAAPEIRLHYAIALARSGNEARAREIAQSLLTVQADHVVAQARALIDNLDKS
jgi:putative PEP-CTERM system TPR-repeat lipoprotein